VGRRGRDSAGQVALQILLVQLAPRRLYAAFSARDRLGASRDQEGEPGVTAGSDFPTFLRSGVRYGVNVCNDANHPGTAQCIADQDAQLILYPLNNMLPPETADRWREKSLANLIDRARQTGCWVASADVTGTSGNLVSHGCTAIVTPEGSVVARVPELEEGVAVYDVPSY